MKIKPTNVEFETFWKHRHFGGVYRVKARSNRKILNDRIMRALKKCPNLRAAGPDNAQGSSFILRVLNFAVW